MSSVKDRTENSAEQLNTMFGGIMDGQQDILISARHSLDAELHRLSNELNSTLKAKLANTVGSVPLMLTVIKEHFENTASTMQALFDTRAKDQSDFTRNLSLDMQKEAESRIHTVEDTAVQRYHDAKHGFKEQSESAVTAARSQREDMRQLHDDALKRVKLFGEKTAEAQKFSEMAQDKAEQQQKEVEDAKWKVAHAEAQLVSVTKRCNREIFEAQSREKAATKRGEELAESLAEQKQLLGSTLEKLASQTEQVAILQDKLESMACKVLDLANKNTILEESNAELKRAANVAAFNASSKTTSSSGKPRMRRRGSVAAIASAAGGFGALSAPGKLASKAKMRRSARRMSLEPSMLANLEEFKLLSAPEPEPQPEPDPEPVKPSIDFSVGASTVDDSTEVSSDSPGGKLRRIGKRRGSVAEAAGLRMELVNFVESVGAAKLRAVQLHDEITTMKISPNDSTPKTPEGSSSELQDASLPCPTQNEAVAVRSAPATLRVELPLDAPLPVPKQPPRLPLDEFSVTFSEQGPLGLLFTCSTPHAPKVVFKITPGSLAAAKPSLCCESDHLVCLTHVQGDSVQSRGIEEIVDMIEQLGRPLVLTFNRTILISATFVKPGNLGLGLCQAQARVGWPVMLDSISHSSQAWEQEQLRTAFEADAVSDCKLGLVEMHLHNLAGLSLHQVKSMIQGLQGSCLPLTLKFTRQSNYDQAGAHSPSTPSAPDCAHDEVGGLPLTPHRMLASVTIGEDGARSTFTRGVGTVARPTHTLGPARGGGGRAHTGNKWSREPNDDKSAAEAWQAKITAEEQAYIEQAMIRQEDMDAEVGATQERTAKAAAASMAAERGLGRSRESGFSPHKSVMSARDAMGEPGGRIAGPPAPRTDAHAQTRYPSRSSHSRQTHRPLSARVERPSSAMRGHSSTWAMQSPRNLHLAVTPNKMPKHRGASPLDRLRIHGRT